RALLGGSTPRRAALMFAGNIASISTIRPHAAQNFVAGINNPAAPATSAIPVARTSKSGRGREGGTIAIKSFFIRVKCDIAVNRNIAASDTRAHTSHDSNTDTPHTTSRRHMTRATDT